LTEPMFQRIRFQGREFLLIGGDTIATEEAYCNGFMSHAHLFEDGTIKQLGRKIGTREDIEILGPLDHEPEINRGAFFNVIRRSIGPQFWESGHKDWWPEDD